MLATQAGPVTKTSKPSTEIGSPESEQQDELLIRDVTQEVLGERRAEWRDGYESGIKVGVQRVMNSHAMEQIAFELTVARIVNDGLIQGAEQREKLLAHWKAEAQWWREEHAKVHAEFCEYAKAIERKFCR